MKITRNGNTRHMHQTTNRIELEVGVGKFTITEECDGALLIHRNNGERLNIVPRCRNECELY